MATQSSAVWRIRKNGNAANGAGFDTGIAGYGTDYSQQDNPQLSLADITCSNTTTVTSATGGFTAAMIGNAIKISGGGSTTGYYWITGYTNTNTITVDRSPGTVSGGTGRVGGAANLPSTIATSVVPGNIIYILGTTGNNVSNYPTTSIDYVESNYFTPTAGTQDHNVKWMADPAGPMPTIGGNSTLIFYNVSYTFFEGLYFVALSNSLGNFGIVNTATGNNKVNKCVFNANNQSGSVCLILSGTVTNSEFYGGTTTPTLSSASYLLNLINYNSAAIGNYFHHGRDVGIYITANSMGYVANNIVTNCAGNGIQSDATTNNYNVVITSNTIYKDGGHGISLGGIGGITIHNIFNNIIANHTGVSKCGIYVSDGTIAANDLRKRLCDYNNLYNNSSNYSSNISPGPNDILNIDPQFVDANNGNFAIGTNLKAHAFPGAFYALSGLNTTSYSDIGAIQREEQSSTGGGPSYFAY